MFMVFNANFNNISDISWRSKLEKTADLSQVIYPQNVVPSTPRHERGSNSQL